MLFQTYIISSVRFVALDYIYKKNKQQNPHGLVRDERKVLLFSHFLQKRKCSAVRKTGRDRKNQPAGKSDE